MTLFTCGSPTYRIYEESTVLVLATFQRDSRFIQKRNTLPFYGVLAPAQDFLKYKGNGRDGHFSPLLTKQGRQYTRTVRGPRVCVKEVGVGELPGNTGSQSSRACARGPARGQC